MPQTQTTQNKLPEGWGVKKLIDFVEFVKGKKPARFVDKKVKSAKPYILISSFESNTNEHYTDDNTCKECFKDDVLIVWDGARAGLSSVGHAGYIGSTITALRQKEKIILPKLLFYFISNHYEIFNKKIQGTGIPHLQKEYIYNLEIPIPPLTTQHLIVQKLDAFFSHYNKLKQEKQKAKEKYERILQSVIVSLIPQGEGLPEGWRKDRLVNLCSKKPQYGYTATSVKEKVGPIYLRITDIDFKGDINWDNVKYVNIPKEEYINFKLEKGDIVIARTGATAGKSYLYNNSKDIVFASYLIRFRCDQNLLLPEYLNLYLQSSLYWQFIYEEQIGTGQPNINATKLGNLKVIYPKDITQQKEIIKRIENLREILNITNKQQKNIDQKLSQLPKAVLSKAFRGEL